MTLKTTRRTLLLAGTAASATIGMPWIAKGAAEFQLKYANNSPTAHPLNVRAVEAMERIKQETNGRVEIQVFPNNQLGSDTDMLSQLRSGAIEFFTLSGLIAMEKQYDNGYRQMTSSTRPIKSPEDLKGFKIRVPPSPLWTSMFKAFDAAPMSINFSEVYSALQTKVAEGQENPLSIIYFAKLFEVQKYLAETNHMWDGFWFLANGKMWNGLPADVRDVIAKNLNASAIEQREDIAKQNATFKADLTSKGMEFVAVDQKPFRAKLEAAGFYKEWRGKYGDEAWAVLEKYAGKIS